MALEDVLTVECGIVAIRVAKAVRRTSEPTIDALIVARDGSGELGAAWSTMTVAEMGELRRFVERVIANEYQREIGGDDGEGD